MKITLSMKQLISNKQTRREIIVTALIFSVFLILFYGGKLLHLNDFLFTNKGDGLKSYYNVVYHAQHGQNLLEHSGMSYPYGEDLCLEDSMPLLNNALFLLAKVFPGLTAYTVGIINVLIFLCLGIGIFVLFLIIKHFGINGYVAAIASNGILFLSSQNLLLYPAGHLGLVFACFFPLGWYFMLRYFEFQNNLKWSILWAVNVVVWSFMHAYLGLILLLFGFFTHLFFLLSDFSKYIKVHKKTWILAIQFLAPILFFLLFFKILDSHPNRIDMPFLDGSRSTLASVFAPNVSPLKTVLTDLTGYSPSPQYNWIKIGTYPGILTILTILIFFVEVVMCSIRGKFKAAITLLPRAANIYILSAIAVLIYSFALPFRLLPENILNQIPYIKQFSSFGRFAWVFYYIITVMVLLYWHLRLRRWKYANIVLAAIGFTFMLEAVPIHKYLNSSALESHNVFNTSLVRQEEQPLLIQQPQQYQAIVPLPSFYKFCVPIEKNHTYNSIYAAMVSSAHSGLPIFSTYLSRPSVSESLNIYKSLQRYPYQALLPQVIDDGRPLAVVFFNADTSTFDANDRAILNKSKAVKVSQEYSLYSLAISDLLQNTNPAIDPQLLSIPHDTIITQPVGIFVYHQSFDSLRSRVSYTGKGAYQGVKKNWNTIFSISTSQMDTANEYVLSFWYYNRLWDQTFNTTVITEIDPEGATKQWAGFSPLQSNIMDGTWYFCEHRFKIHSTKNTLKLISIGEDKFENWFAIDEVLIRPAMADVNQIRHINDSLYVYKNGLLFTKPLPFNR
jgi:hypothetical protein